MTASGELFLKHVSPWHPGPTWHSSTVCLVHLVDVHVHAGHWAQDCPNKSSAGNNAGGADGTQGQGHGTKDGKGGSHAKPDDVCYRCGQKGGHLGVMVACDLMRSMSPAPNTGHGGGTFCTAPWCFTLCVWQPCACRSLGQQMHPATAASRGWHAVKRRRGRSYGHSPRQ
jgi:hypothetical protein